MQTIPTKPIKKMVDRRLPFNFSIKHLAGQDLDITVLISKTPIGKPFPISNYYQKIMVAKISKFISFINASDIQLIDKFNSQCYLIGQISKNSNDATLRNKNMATILNLVISRLKVCSFEHFCSNF